MSKILVIDDETVLREELVDLLTFAGYDVIGAENGETGISYAAKYHPDLILCDVTMPEMDGHRVLSELRSDPLTADIRFIFMTARAAEEDVQQGLNLGADYYITKPFRHDDLIAAIESKVGK